MSKGNNRFLGSTYSRTDIDFMDGGNVKAAIYRYLETGNADELFAVMNEPGARTGIGQRIINDLLNAAQADLSGSSDSRDGGGKHSCEVSDYFPGF